MKSRADMPLAFLRGTRNVLLACLLAAPLVEVDATEGRAPALLNIEKLVNVTGKVVDQDGKPVPGATVLVKGTKSGVKTDENGVFRLNMPAGNEVIIVSYVGYKVQEVDVSGRTDVTVQLESTAAIDEVVVTGYGTKKRSEIVGSIATITGEELMDIPASNIAGAMRNRIAGVGVSQVSGRPGSGITLNVRNASTSQTASQFGVRADPLYIIDGIVVEKDAFDNIDASMVENISILKDAAAAIYGAAGAKGVVLVTTKRGKIGKPSISYNGYMGISDAARTPEMLSAYEHAELMNQTNSVNNASAGTFFSEEDLEYLKGLKLKSWFDEMWQASLTQRHNLSISGGSERVTFFAGGSYQNENANYAGMKFDKYSFRSGLTANIGKGLRADINFNVDHTLRFAQHNLSESDAGFFESIIRVPQWVPIRINDMLVNYDNSGNPLATLESGYYNNNKSRGYRINSSLTYQPEFLKGFTARFQISQGGTNFNSRQYIPPFEVYDFERIGNNNELFTDQLIGPYAVTTPSNARITPSLGEASSYQGFLTLQYGRTLGLHTFDVITGGEQSESNNESLSVYWMNQMIPGGEEWWAFDNNTLTRGNFGRGETSKRSFFGRFSYDFDKKYLVEGVARLDASSNFALGNRWGWSPSIGLGWVVSREDFFADNISFINFLKLKFNYGITGDDRVDARLWQERFTIDTSNGYLFGENNGNGLNPSVIPNPNITWEKKRTMNFGMEMSLLNNALDIGVEFFQNHAYDVFDRGGNDLLPLYVGLMAPVVNYQERYNWGSEFTIGYKTKIANVVNFSGSMNFGYGNSIITRAIYAPGDLLEPNIEDGLAHAFGTDPRKYNTSNYGLNYVDMFRTQEQVDAFMSENPNYRIYNSIPQPGWMQFEDSNGDGVISDYDLEPMFENTNPIFATGLTLGFGYKSFNLSTNINARIGGKVSYDGRARIEPEMTRNVLSIWKDRWTPDNPDGMLPRFDDPALTRNSTFWVVDGTMVRINNMTFSYRVPDALASRAGLSNARLLLTGNNLWTLVNPLKYKDPYTSSAYDYPVLRTISLGLSVNL